MDDRRVPGSPPLPMGHRAVILLTAVFVVLVGVTKPYYNWDVIGYVASAHFEDGLRGTELRDRTYGDIRAEVDDPTFALLIYEGYRRKVYADPRSLEQQIPIYSIKEGYVQLIRAAGRAGVSYPRATFYVSAIFSGMSVVVLGMLSGLIGLPMIAFPFLALGAGHLDVARASVPDAPACFLSLLAVYFALKRSRWLYIASAALPLLRTDYIILSALLMGYQFYAGQRKPAVVSLLFSIAVYVGIAKMRGDYGWATLFNVALITGPQPFPAEAVISTRPMDYVRPYLKVWLAIFSGTQLAIYCLSAYIIIREFRSQKREREFWLIFLIPAAFLALHLCAFPLYEERYFIFSASLLLLGIFDVVARYGLNKSNRADT